MFKIASETELLESFRDLDRAEVELSQDLRFPLVVSDYLSWAEPSGHRSFIVFSTGARRPPMGIVFRRETGGGASPAVMCEWCHRVRAGGEVSLMTAAASGSRRVGVYLCRNLSCREKTASLPGVNDLPERVGEPLIAHRVQQKALEFARRNLF